MIDEINPFYDDFLALPFEMTDVKVFYCLFAKLGQDNTDEVLIAFSDTSREEIVDYRSELIERGYYFPLSLYIQNIPNFNYKKRVRSQNSKLMKLSGF